MFFSKPPLGINISDYSIEIISLDGPTNHPRLLSAGRKILAPGIFINGKILGKEKLKENLNDLLQNLQFGGLRTKKIISSIPESKSFIHVFNLPGDMPQKEILDYVKVQARENFPYSLADIFFDFQIKNNEALLVASPRKIVDDYLEIFESCGLEPAVFEIESLSLGRVFLGERDETILIVDIGARTTDISVFREGKLRFSFSLPRAGDNFTIIEEIRKIEDYCREKTGQRVKKIILAGGSGSLPKLKEYLAENLSLSVDIGDPWVKIDIDILGKKEHLKESLGVDPVLYSTVIGAALRGLEKNPEKSGINILKGRS